ncbi:hypothetical protein ACFWCD_09185 [Streptomyces goshikiensis]
MPERLPIREEIRTWHTGPVRLGTQVQALGLARAKRTPANPVGRENSCCR